MKRVALLMGVEQVTHDVSGGTVSLATLATVMRLPCPARGFAPSTVQLWKLARAESTRCGCVAKVHCP